MSSSRDKVRRPRKLSPLPPFIRIEPLEGRGICCHDPAALAALHAHDHFVGIFARTERGLDGRGKPRINKLYLIGRQYNPYRKTRPEKSGRAFFSSFKKLLLGRFLAAGLLRSASHDEPPYC